MKKWPELSSEDKVILERIKRGLTMMPLSKLEKFEAERYVVFALDKSKK